MIGRYFIFGVIPPKDKGFVMLLVTFADWRPALLLDFSVRIMSILPLFDQIRWVCSWGVRGFAA